MHTFSGMNYYFKPEYFAQTCELWRTEVMVTERPPGGISHIPEKARGNLPIDISV